MGGGVRKDLKGARLTSKNLFRKLDAAGKRETDQGEVTRRHLS